MSCTRRRAAAAAGAALLALALAGCAGGAAADAPTWVPAPQFSGEGDEPSAIPTLPSAPGGAAPSSSPSAAPSGGPTTPADDPSVLATGLTAPDTVAILPDGSGLVGERTTGRILRVQPVPHQPVQVVRTVPGLGTDGGGGLLDLALSPGYSQDGLILALITTPTDTRVVAFTLTGAITPVLTGIPRGSSDNGARLVVGDDGLIYVGAGDAGTPAAAADPASLAGKVLRVTDIGRPAPDNPTPGSAVFAGGLRLVAGLCAEPTSGQLVEIDRGIPGGDEVNLLRAGADYGWPAHKAASVGPAALLPSAASGAGGCAITSNSLYVTSLDGQSLLGAPISTSSSGALSLGPFTSYLKGKYGRLLAITAAPDGALWLTTSNKDGHGRPVAADERVLRIQAPTSEANYPG